jgi:hypothetical protein
LELIDFFLRDIRVPRLGNRRKIYGLARRIRSNIGYKRIGKSILFYPETENCGCGAGKERTLDKPVIYSAVNG